MIGTNIMHLRKMHQMTQEDLAEKLNVSRQAIAKWESNESCPDIINCEALSSLFNVTIDDLVHHSAEDSGLVIPPKGKHLFGLVTVGERGQIVIPKKARDLFNIKPGDQLVILGDEGRGLAIVHQQELLNFVDPIGVAPDNKRKA